MARHLTDEKIDLLVDEQFEQLEEGDVREHLDSCPTCASELDLARRIDGALASVPQMVAPPALLEGVMATIEKARAQQRRLLLSLFVLTALGVALLGGWLFAGGAATVALEAMDLTRTLGAVTRVVGAIGRAFPVELLAASLVTLVLCSLGLGRVITRTRVAEAGLEA